MFGGSELPFLPSAVTTFSSIWSNDWLEDSWSSVTIKTRKSNVFDVVRGQLHVRLVDADLREQTTLLPLHHGLPAGPWLHDPPLPQQVDGNVLMPVMLMTWTRAYPGVWEVPLVMWNDLKEGRCSMADACNNPSTAEVITPFFHSLFVCFNVLCSQIHQPVVNPDTRILKALLIESCPFLSKTCTVRFCLSKSLLSIMILYLQGVYYMIMKNFQRHYNTNRAPFGLSYHPAWSVLYPFHRPCQKYFSFQFYVWTPEKGEI